jgi:biopolymer transport protein ExbB
MNDLMQSTDRKNLMRHTPQISARIATTLASLALCVLALSPLTASAQPASAAAAATPVATEPASAAAPAPAPMTAAPTSKETVDNPYGLGALWEQGDFVARGTLIILVLMSMGSWYILSPSSTRASS